MSIAKRLIPENDRVAPGGGWSKRNGLSKDNKRHKKRHRQADLEMRRMIQQDSSDEDLGKCNREILANKKQKKRILFESDNKNNEEAAKVSTGKVLQVETPSDQVKSNKKTAKKMVASSKSSKSKKVYTMPGQKKDTPGELNGARIFYESLRQQNPKSKMAEEYLLKHGLLPYEEAAAIVKAQQKLKSKTKSVTTKKSNVEKNAKKTKGEKTKKVKKQSKVQMESGKPNSTKKKTKGARNKKDARKKNTKKALQLSSSESSSDEIMIKKTKPRKSTKKTKRKTKHKAKRK